MNTIDDALYLIALQLNARSVALINKKTYRFYLTGEQFFDITKDELELDFLKAVKQSSKWKQ